MLVLTSSISWKRFTVHLLFGLETRCKFEQSTTSLRRSSGSTSRTANFKTGINKMQERSLMQSFFECSRPLHSRKAFPTQFEWHRVFWNRSAGYQIMDPWDTLWPSLLLLLSLWPWWQSTYNLNEKDPSPGKSRKTNGTSNLEFSSSDYPGKRHQRN